MADEPKPPQHSELYAEAKKEFEARLDKYTEEWETSLREALTARPIEDAAAPKPLAKKRRPRKKGDAS